MAQCPRATDDLRNYMLQFREPVPSWLMDFRPGDPLCWDDLVQSRVFFYPGSGLDGCPLKVFGASHACHCFIYADHAIPNEGVYAAAARNELGVLGYDVIATSPVHLSRSAAHDGPGAASLPSDGPERGTFVVLERTSTYGEGHGPRRLAWLFLESEAVRAFLIIHCARRAAPFATLLRRYMGYDFIHEGDLESAARQHHCFPEFIQGPPDDQIDWHGRWQGYARVAGGVVGEAIYRRW